MLLKDGVLEYFNIKSATRQQSILFFIFLAGMVLVFSVSAYIFSYLRKKKRREARNEDFERLLVKSRLHEKEVDLLRQLTKLSCPDDPPMILTSLKVFDRGAKLLKNNLSKMQLGETNTIHFLNALTILRKKIENLRIGIMPKLNHTSEIKENQRVQILLSPDESFPCYVLNSDKQRLALTVPTQDGNEIKLSPGTKLKVYFWRNDDAGYSFETEILGLHEGTISALYVQHSDKISRTQMREYIRIPTRTQVNYKLRSSTASIPKDKNDFTGQLTNISGGGGSIVSKSDNRTDQIEIGNLIELRFSFKVDSPQINTMGRIVHIQLNEKDRTFTLSVEFVGIDEKTREEIIKYVFNIQFGTK